MTDYTVKRLALVLTIQAEIEGMKTRNELNCRTGCNPVYDESCFYEKQIELIDLANKPNEQL